MGRYLIIMNKSMINQEREQGTTLFYILVFRVGISIFFFHLF
jgi:hypothetical protein